MIPATRTPTTRRTLRRLALAAGFVLTSTALLGCGPERTSPAGPADRGTAPATSVPRTEVEGTRIGVSYDGGVMILDRSTLEVVADLPLPGFLRLNPAGDQRHLLVSTAEGFRLLDTGVQVEAHGDHAHYYGTDPVLTDVTYPAAEPGHVVRHAEQVALFSDGAGTVQLSSPSSIADGTPDRTFTSASPHHGVAVPLPVGRLLVSIGTAEERVGAQVVDASGAEVARSESCPGVHGEATTGDGAVVLGCTDGILLFRDQRFTKIDSPDDYGRIGNQAGSEESEVVLGDYKTDPDAELERPERVSLIDTTSRRLRLVDLGTSYSFRSLARGPEGEALVLGTDGKIHVIDPDTGRAATPIAVTRPWTEPDAWQRPRPAIHVDGILAYVTEPATSTVHVVDLDTGRRIDSASLPHEPNEITGVG